ncbi:MAG: DUF4231 domain-containing protein [Salinivirgaceae bacterium]
MSIKRYYFGNNKKDKSTISELIENIELDDYQRKYLTIRIPEILDVDFDRIAIQSKFFFQLFKILTIISGILVPIVANFNPEFKLFNMERDLIITILGIISALSFSFLQTFKYERIGLQHRIMYENLRTETFKFITKSENYSGYTTHREAFFLFAEKIETMIKNDIYQYASNVEKSKDE